MKFQTRYGKGWNVFDATTGAPQSRQNEFNFEVEYQPMYGPFENLHVQQVVRARDGERTGIGVLEQIVIGPYAPAGFTGLLDGA